MKKLSFLLIVALIFGITNVSIDANAEDYSSTITMFRGSPVVAKFFKNSYGYAVFPTIGKGAYVVGGSYGEGQVYQHGKVKGKTTVIEGSIGFQAGGEAFSEIIFLKDKRAYDAFTSGKFEFDATAQAVVITAGADAQVATTGATAGATAGSRGGVHAKTGYVNGIATFVHAQGGLMIGVSVGGQKFTFEPK